MSGKITITNQSPDVAVIDIEGTIGVSEKRQFQEQDDRVATYEKFREVTDSLKKIKASEIVVNIRSTGGNVNDALLIFEALKELGGCVTTRCFGYVASAATIIAQAASPGRREISSNSLYLIHRSVCAAEGNAEEISRSLDMLGKTDQRIANVYAERSGKPAKNFSQLMDENNGNGRWLSPEEAVGFSLADRIIGRAPIAADAKKVIKEFGLPPLPKNKKFNPMNFSRRWNAILEKLGLIMDPRLGQNQEAIVADGAGESLKDETIRQMEAGQVEILEKHQREVAELQNRISILESQNARLAVRPTMTMPKEDPSPQEMKRSPNDEAYYEDLRGFMS